MTESCSAERKKIILDNLAAVKQGIEDAAAQSGRKASDITLIGVTKTVPPEDINVAIDAGADIIGENKAQELLDKLPYIHPREAHFIGNLQSNKVKYIIDKVSLIQSASSLSLIREINRQAEKHSSVMDILLECNIGREESKGGFFVEELDAAAEYIAELKNIRLRGLMAIPPICTSDEAKRYFTKMFELYVDFSRKKGDNIDISILSMGMSADFREAILCGANTVRVGSAIFGKRIYKQDNKNTI